MISRVTSGTGTGWPESRVESAEAAAASSDPLDPVRYGVVDALVFRRLIATTWAHLGGIGRGRGWAGVVDVAATDTQLRVALPAPGEIRRFDHARSERVLGPYYAFAGALIRVSDDDLVLLGNPAGALSGDATDEILLALAAQIDSGVDNDITPAKKLADELEVLHAVRAVTTVVGADLADTLQRVTDVAAAALSCEVGLIRDRSGRIAAWTSTPDLGPSGPIGDDPASAAEAALHSALDTLELRAAAGRCCVQDIAEDAELMGLRRWNIRSVLAVLIPPPVGGILVTAHTDSAPRGFTGLCQQLGQHVADAAGVVAHTAALRDELRVAADGHAREARRDPLTGLGNRLAWEEALDSAAEMLADGRRVTVVTLDLDGLKLVNDTYGHEAGDRLLCACAAVLCEQRLPGDACVRIGGDEFGLLIPYVGDDARRRVDAIIDRLDAASSNADLVAASVGVAEAGPDLSIADAVRQADMSMYDAKRRRRAAHGASAVRD